MIYETYSERQRNAEKNTELYQYDAVPDTLRVQVQQILRDAIGPHVRGDPYGFRVPCHNPETWQFVHKTLCREFALHSLSKAETQGLEVLQFLGACNAHQFIDSVELCARVIVRVISKWSPSERKHKGVELCSAEAIEELNYRFRKSGFGFQFVDGEAFRIDSELIHREAVEPALRILNVVGYEGARDEFLVAHRHYRAGDFEDSITQAAKAFESVLKITCDKHGWLYSPGARSSDLIKVVRSQGLWPEYLDNSFDQLLATLTSGLPKVRNERGAHGQGSISRRTPDYVAAYALHLSATKIVFITEASKERAAQPRV